MENAFESLPQRYPNESKSPTRRIAATRDALMFSPTLLTHLQLWADLIPDQTAVCTADVRLTWSELAASSQRIAAGLLALGVRRGGRIGILMHNRVEFAAALLGILRAGGIVTLLN